MGQTTRPVSSSSSSRLLVPIMVEECHEGLLSQGVQICIHGLDEATARKHSSRASAASEPPRIAEVLAKLGFNPDLSERGPAPSSYDD